jgi:hypothetical protein
MGVAELISIGIKKVCAFTRSGFGSEISISGS